MAIGLLAFIDRFANLGISALFAFILLILVIKQLNKMNIMLAIHGKILEMIVARLHLPLSEEDKTRLKTFVNDQ